MRIHFLNFILLLVVLFACESDPAMDPVVDPEPQDQHLLSLTTQDRFIDEQDLAYYIVKGIDGSILDANALTFDDSIGIKLPYEHDRFALIVVRNHVAANNVSFRCYLDLPLGKSLRLKNPRVLDKNDANIRITGSNFDFDDIFITSAGVSRQIYAETLWDGVELGIRYLADDVFTLLIKRKDGAVPSFQTFELDPSQIKEVDLDQNQPMPETHTINTFRSIKENRALIFGISNENKKYLLHHSEELPNNGSLTVHTPGLFDQFDTTLGISEGQTVIQQLTTGPIPTEFTEFDPEINILNSDLPQLHVKAEMGTILTRSIWGRPGVVVSVTAGPEARDNYLLHDIPQEILEAVGITDFEDVELASVTAMKVGDASYDEVIKEEFQGEIRSRPHVLYKWINF